MSGQETGGQPELRDQIAERLKWACGHFQDDPECAYLTAAGLEELHQVQLDAADARHRDMLTGLRDATLRAETAEAELEQWREAVERVREIAEAAKQSAAEASEPGDPLRALVGAERILAALDQPAKESGEL